MPKFQIPTRLDLLKIEMPDTPADRVAEKRRIRKHQVLDIIRCHGPIPRVEIARLLGFNLPSVSSLVDDLLSEGLATEDKAIKTAIGRRPIPVVFNPNAASIIGIDVGKTAIIGLLMDLGGTILGRLEKPAPAPLDFTKLPAFLEQFVHDLLQAHLPTLPPLAGVGIGLPGLIYQPNNTHELQFFPPIQALKEHMMELLGVPVIIDNDARMSSYGELRFGAMAGHDSMAIVNLGYGLGLGLIINGTVYQGYHGHASELGHSPMGEPGIKCHCGLTSCLENIASGSGLERLCLEAGLHITSQVTGAADLAALVRGGDARAREIFDRFARALARGIASVINMFNPEIVVLSGRVARASDVFLELLLAEIKEMTYPIIHAETKIVVSNLFENAGPLGACACVLHHIFSSAHISVESIV